MSSHTLHMGTLPTRLDPASTNSFASEPNLKSVRELIYKRGYGKVNKQRIPLSNNSVIEEALGKFDILSVEDLVHEIVTAGPNFKQVSFWSSPFIVAWKDADLRLFRRPTSSGPSSSRTPTAAGEHASSSTTSRVVTTATARRTSTSSSAR